MNCSIISVGTEILFGQIVNTNTVYLSQQLNELGINVYHHFAAGDNATRLRDILSFAIDKSDLIITTGGLGPTQDDLTKETIAQAIDTKLVIHEASLERLKAYFKHHNRTMSDNNLKQVYLPEKSIVLQNDCGTAPGFITTWKDKTIICLPGPPKEMKAMFNNYVKKYLKEQSKETIHSRVLRFFEIGESALESELNDLITYQTNPTLATYAKEGEVSLRITAKASSVEEANSIIHPVLNEIVNRLGDYIYSYEDEELVEVVAKKLLEKNLSISLAESCTGGLLAAKLTGIPGISTCFDRSIVTYSNQAKIQELGVDPTTLQNHGAVSEETAKEMVIGLKSNTNSDICIAITGIAGPSGATEDKPVGLVYISMAYNSFVVCNKYIIGGDRERIRNYSSLLALNMIRSIL